MTRISALFAALEALVPEGFSLSAVAACAVATTLFFALFSAVVTTLLYRSRRNNHRLQTELSAQRRQLHEYELQNTRLSTRLESDERLFIEKLNLLQEARDELKQQFELLAGKIFSEKTERLSELNHHRLDEILSPFGQRLEELRRQISDIYTADSRERFALKEEISRLEKQGKLLGEEASLLSRALKSDNRIAGNWGELTLSRLLETAGLSEGREFSTQQSFRSADGSLLRPDLLIHLPDERRIIIDAKTSLLPWSRCVAATDEKSRTAALKELTTSLRRHAEGLAKKNYPGITGLHSLDFVLMFIPVEAAFAAACSHDPELIEEALRRNVIMISPSTLLTTLRTIENLWKFDRQGKNAREIAGRASLLYDKFCGFVSELEKVARQLDIARSSCDAAFNRLSRGRGNLISQAEQLRSLGIQPAKELPQKVLDRAEL